jgi:hypothetical protein
MESGQTNGGGVMALRGTLTHWKTRMLAQSLGIDPAFALGILESLWHVTAEDAPSGNIGRLPNQAIAMQMFTSIDPDRLIEALIASRHLDRHPVHRLVVHDWDKHADYNTKRKVARHNGSMYTVGGEVQPITRDDASSTAESCPPVPVPVPEPGPNTLTPQVTTLVEIASDVRRGPYSKIIEQVFVFYCKTLNRNPHQYTLTPRRKDKAILRLKEREKETGSLAQAQADLEMAISNVAADEFLTSGGYTGWEEQIFKSREEFEKRLNWKAPTPKESGESKPSPTQQRVSRNRQAIAKALERRIGSLRASNPLHPGYQEPSEVDHIAQHIDETYGSPGSPPVLEMVEKAKDAGVFSESTVSPDLVIDVLTEWREMRRKRGLQPLAVSQAIAS